MREEEGREELEADEELTDMTMGKRTRRERKRGKSDKRAKSVIRNSQILSNLKELDKNLKFQSQRTLWWLEQHHFK